MQGIRGSERLQYDGAGKDAHTVDLLPAGTEVHLSTGDGRVADAGLSERGAFLDGMQQQGGESRPLVLTGAVAIASPSAESLPSPAAAASSAARATHSEGTHLLSPAPSMLDCPPLPCAPSLVFPPLSSLHYTSSATVSYVVGLIAALVAGMLTSSPQPALLYIVSTGELGSTAIKGRAGQGRALQCVSVLGGVNPDAWVNAIEVEVEEWRRGCRVHCVVIQLMKWNPTLSSSFYHPLPEGMSLFCLPPILSFLLIPLHCLPVN